MENELLQVAYNRNPHSISVNAQSYDKTQYNHIDNTVIMIEYTINGEDGNEAVNAGALHHKWQS